MKLRDYQLEAEKDIYNYIKDPKEKDPVVVVQPCGAGKSLLIAVTAKMTDKPVLVLQPSKELLEQNYDKFIHLGGEAYLYSASLGVKEKGKTTYGTPKTVITDVKLFKDVEVVIIDECHYHCSRGSVIHDILKEVKPKKVIGMTATPCMLHTTMATGTRLLMLPSTSKSIFKKIIHVTQVQHLVKNNYWSELEYFQESFNDKFLIKNSSGNDFTEDSIVKSYEANNTNGKIKETFHKMSKKGIKHILVFVPTVDIGEELVNKHLKDKVEMIHAKTPKKERKRILEDFKSGVLKGVVTVDVLTTGFDFPELDGIICARSTNSFAIFYQMLGRGVRIHKNKEKCTIVDLCGIVKRFGKVEDIVIEDFKQHGWAIFCSGDYVITGYDLSSNPITREEYLKMLNKKSTNYRKGAKGPIKNFWFGKHRGLPLERVPINYMSWMLANEEFNWYFRSDIPKNSVDEFKKELLEIIRNEQHRQIN